MSPTKVAVGTLLLLLPQVEPSISRPSESPNEIRLSVRNVLTLTTDDNARLSGGDLDGRDVKGSAAESDDFVPADIAHAVAIACLVTGDAGPAPFAEAQVAVRYAGPAHSGDKLWDYKPIIARYTQRQGGVLAAIDDCNKWYRAVRKRIVAAAEIEHDVIKER